MRKSVLTFTNPLTGLPFSIPWHSVQSIQVCKMQFPSFGNNYHYSVVVSVDGHSQALIYYTSESQPAANEAFQHLIDLWEKYMCPIQVISNRDDGDEGEEWKSA